MQRLGWSDIPQWDADDHAAAWAAFAIDAPRLNAKGARLAFEIGFEAFEVTPPGTARFTGYYEPELAASPIRTDDFPAPLYAMPPGLPSPWLPRADIIAGDLLAGYEIAYVSSRIEAFLAQVQGSVRLRMTDGSVWRLGYAGKNGQPYASIGRELVRRGVALADQMTPDAIRIWCAENPDLVTGLLNTNPSFVFFRVLDLPPETGPIGSMGLPVTARRSLAVDPAVIPLGAPVWIDCPGFGARLMVAQDTGSAIKGAGRGDIFIGSGADAGRIAGGINTAGRMIWLRRRT
ncbi:MAG TPA: MltA domain-containing protein [Paenirhodobacter sp.]